MGFLVLLLMRSLGLSTPGCALRRRAGPVVVDGLRGRSCENIAARSPTPREGVAKDGAIRYRAPQRDCDACMLKPKCCPNMLARKIARSVHEGARDKVRAIAKTEAYAVSCRERKKVERLFAHLKRILRLGRLRHRGPTGANDEFLLAPPPKISGNWRSSSLIRRRSSPHEAKSQESASLTAPQIPSARARTAGFFNKIDVERT